MDIKTKRRNSVFVIAVALFLICAGMANFFYQGFSTPSFIMMFVVTIVGIYAIGLAATSFNATPEESAEEYQDQIKAFEADGYRVRDTPAKIVPYVNKKVVRGRNFWGTVQDLDEETFEDEKVTILLDSFFVSDAEVSTSVSVRVIRAREYVVIHDTLNDRAVWLTK